jgi:hypothetical protein
VLSSVRLSAPVTPSRVIVSVSSRPSLSDAAAPRALELAGERPELLERLAVIVARPRAAQPSLDGRPVALGQVLDHVALLVHVMPTSA